MMIQNKSIAIVGGGPGGLTLARLLQLKGATVKVYERDVNRNARVQGSPLDMHEYSGLAAIRKADLLDAFKQLYRSGADRMIITDEQATIFYSDHGSKPQEDFGNQHFRPEIDRGPLRNMLLDSLQEDTVVWDSHFFSMAKQGEGWMLHFKNGLLAYADLVIAADGANSKIRPYITPIKAVYTGITMLEGNISNAAMAAPTMYALANNGKIMAFGNSKNILLGQKGNGDLGFYASIKVDESWATTNALNYADKAQMLDWFKAYYEGWNPIWLELFENVVMPFIPRPIYCMPTNQTWQSLPNLTMIGDAAHVMPPFAGEGANMAMLDALELSECLLNSEHNSLPEAINRYEIAMCKRAALAATESLENGEKMHAPTALKTMLDFFAGH